MARNTGQRIGIWIIAIVMVVGTMGSFVGIILANNNAQSPAGDDDLQAQIEEQQQLQEQAALDNAAASEPFNDDYEASEFAADEVSNLQVRTLEDGSGEREVTAEDVVSVSYFGWTPDGVIFDSSQKEGTNTPIENAANGFIEGFNTGLLGMKEGEVRKFVIPGDQAYVQGNPPLIDPAEPLTFIVRLEAINPSEE